MALSHYLAVVLACLPLLLSGAERYVRDQNGIEVLGLKNEYWNVEVAPLLGGKIYSLFDRQSGREWMWSRFEDRAIAKSDGEAFGNACLIGWDEILPTLEASTWKGNDLPGHGELWSSELDVDHVAWSDGVIQTMLDLDSLPLRYSREVSLDHNIISFRYSLENISDESIPFLWALHPLFSIEPGDQIEADFGEGIMQVVAAAGLKPLKAGDQLSWPGKERGLDLTRFSLGDVPKAGMKFFLASPRDGKITLLNDQSGDKLEIRYDTTALPWLGFWLARGVWGGAHHFALEPTNRLGEAIAEGDVHKDSAGWLQPGEIREWWLVLESKSNV
ncbi:hypothetical protein [Rubellicoccus peritrichatus]|uniref:Galactose mutarotase-like enzyme n=1 Tax=Rubellicoccus peritrichatus TaxID=3080537 RepID=A0AAQ3LJD5_9BACT|nr:hypothetical protein [Puniceicoccus sp. CR14]WOO43279.1 hypothetical protein RZN69_09270 [Puniceicoccus sp. CR14]